MRVSSIEHCELKALLQLLGSLLIDSCTACMQAWGCMAARTDQCAVVEVSASGTF